ncbi:hypothetical protein GCM10009104_20240 [Marinobacterium maritimum]|uniref:Type IV pilus modification protein PilV n=1 Tax=Marinobacterium maritimum TaxID=500162 RepID=A0ABN1I6Q2_9GAMM
MDLKAIPRLQIGFSLLESLIALVVFSVALLGLAAMYTKTMSMSHSSYLRALASIQAMDLEERIRANPLSADADYVFSCSFSETFPGTMAGTPATLAGLDQKDWCAGSKRVFGGLLNTATVVASYPTAASTPVDYRITLGWTERMLDADGKQKTGQSPDFVYTVRK